MCSRRGSRVALNGLRVALGVPFKNLVQKSARVRIGGRLKMSPNGSPKTRFEHLLPQLRLECLATAGAPAHS